MIQFAAAAKALPWKLIGYAALALFIGGLMLALKMERAHAAKLQAQIEKCAEARKADRASYGRAQAEAAAKNLREVREIEQRQEEISREAVETLNTRLRRLRSELRGKGAAAPTGATGQPGLPQSGNPAAGTDGAAGLCLTAEQLLRAAENEERHDRLIDWAEQQLNAR